MRSAGRVIEKSRAFLEQKLDKDDNLTTEDIKDVQYALEKILDFAGKLPDRIEILDRADSLINNEGNVLRGGKQKRKSHDPQ